MRKRESASSSLAYSRKRLSWRGAFRHNEAMGRPYGRIKRQSRRTPRAPNDKSFKVKLQRKDGEPLSMSEMREVLHELAERLLPLDESCRVKRATLYLTAVDQNGSEIVLDERGEWIISPYSSAADELGV
ncbi:MAG: hypothetical protein AB7S70_00365 [Hyphomicrobium sp.]|uniref:hypothetical protein n=1 Tax=Hyphomicrobium sp. TaxID=82 RepID=UPI003D13BB37